MNNAMRPNQDFSIQHQTNSLHIKASDVFGSNVFGPDAMTKHLSKDAVKAINDSVKSGNPVDRKLADEIANGMMNWAMQKGATHYTHWFQPLRGSTAEKHDSFFEPTGNGKGVESFSGKALIQQEPDASSFPNGGIRNTFEARGYSAWDPSSPAFIIEKPSGNTLCIPTIFISYTGEALDYKVPLLRSLNFLKKNSVEVCKYFDENVESVSVSLGVEQEYFLVDKELFNARPDLVATGRTILGHRPSKGQQMDDHYFGVIPDRAFAFMTDLEYEAWKLGIPLMTRHNEVAPCQFECAPMFEDLNLGNDHNSLLMYIMEQVASRHNLAILLHEKPFDGVNGSGKHNNWSIVTNTGVNLLAPGKDDTSNLQFLTFFINTLKAVHDHADLLRASIASAGNDHRLGANEAPPAIMSAFIGTTCTNILEEFAKSGERSGKGIEGKHIDVPSIPELLIDNTDRNRTSPFAFTGNKFEFRAVGSNDNCSSPMTVLNTIMGNQLETFKKEVDALIAKGKNKEDAISEILVKDYRICEKILYDGNGYGDEWVQEAKKRGLANLKTTPDALDAYTTDSAIKLFEDAKVLTKKEIEARSEIKYENYTLSLQIEGRLMGEMIMDMIVPTAINYQNKVASNLKMLKELDVNKSLYTEQTRLLETLCKNIDNIIKYNYAMIEERRLANLIEDESEKAKAYCNKVKPWFTKIRDSADLLERLVDDAEWPLPKYRELLVL